MSVVKLESVEFSHKQVIINISGLDLLDQTPILDIKPYIPYSDNIDYARAGFAQYEPAQLLNVIFSSQAEKDINKYKNQYTDLSIFIEQVLSQDPRPAYKKKQVDEKIYGMSLYDLNILWTISLSDTNTIEVLSINEAKL
jgi:hypothetical protein